RDETVLRHLADHYASAARNVRAFAAVAGENVSLTHANDLAGQGVVFLEYDYTLRSMTALASKLFAKFCADWRNRAVLPDAVTRWRRGQLAKIAEQRAVASPFQPLRLGCGQQQLTVRLVLAPAEPPMLVLTETREAITIEALSRFGLTPRE